MTSTDYINKSIRIRRKIYGIAGALITLAVPFFLMQHNADHHLDTAQSLCPFKLLTGFPCPGCGITKSLVYLYDGNLYKSLYYHIFGPFVILFCVVTVFVLSAELATEKEYFNKWLYNRKLAVVLGITLAVYHSVRLVYFVMEHNWDDVLKQSIWK
ncbi:DUF2752 domain-containing protein [Flavobacterium sp.]|uniref:DUF2752 domain-containing protein n=1 Tax=Flavobacterium sp. TaxID=239 RepID=UPI002610C345|nr:DUF2752 domain-containing protein [Flavobacterium sp.]